MVESLNSNNNNNVNYSIHLPNVDVVGDLSKSKQKSGTGKIDDINSKPSIFGFPGDRNKNSVVDYQDFDCVGDAKLFEEKGLIGKTWDYCKENLGKLFGIKSATVEMKWVGYNNEDFTDTMEYDDEGKLVTYKQQYSENGGFIRKFTYDEHGNKNGYDLSDIRPDKSSQHTDIINEYDSEGNLFKSTESMGGVNIGQEVYYDKEGNVIGIRRGAEREVIDPRQNLDEHGRIRVFKEIQNESGELINVEDTIIYDINKANYKNDKQTSTVEDFRKDG